MTRVNGTSVTEQISNPNYQVVTSNQLCKSLEECSLLHSSLYHGQLANYLPVFEFAKEEKPFYEISITTFRSLPILGRDPLVILHT